MVSMFRKSLTVQFIRTDFCRSVMGFELSLSLSTGVDASDEKTYTKMAVTPPKTTQRQRISAAMTINRFRLLFSTLFTLSDMIDYAGIHWLLRAGMAMFSYKRSSCPKLVTVFPPFSYSVTLSIPTRSCLTIV